MRHSVYTCYCLDAARSTTRASGGPNEIDLAAISLVLRVLHALCGWRPALLGTKSTCVPPAWYQVDYAGYVGDAQPWHEIDLGAISLALRALRGWCPALARTVIAGP